MRTIIEMVNLTRLDCAIASAGQSRIALSQALNHIRNRSVFQRKLADQPSMRATVADLALELEAQVALVFRLVPRLRARRDDPARSRLRAPADAGGEIPGVQEHAAARLRIARMPGRQRLHRGPAAGALLPRIAAQRHLGRLGQRHGARRAARRRPPSRPGDGDRDARSAKTAAAAFDVRPLAETLAKVLQSGDAERRARFLCEGLAKIAALAALAEAKSDFATLYGDTRLRRRALRPVRHGRPRRRRDRR